MIRFTTKDCREYFSSDFIDLRDALNYVSNLEPDDTFYVDDYFDRRAKISKSEIKTIGLPAEEEFIDNGDVDRKIRNLPTVDEMDINPDLIHINELRVKSNIINLADYRK